VDDCIFCKIGRNELNARIVYEDDAVVAFHDISPQAPVHVLVVPREHYTNFNDAVSSTVSAALCAAVPKVAQLTGIAGSGYRIIVNNGPDSNQTVPHLHVHVMGGRRMTHGMVSFAE
jgi:histidine triad (HIT) family protein